MKKILFFVILILIAYKTEAQRGLTLGINGSYNSTWILYPNAYGVKIFDNTKSDYYVPSYGYDYGIGIGHNFVDVLGVKAEITNSFLTQEYDNSDSGTKRTIKLNYLKVPIMLRLSTAGDKFVFHLMFGPEFGFLSSAKQEEVTGGDTLINNVSGFYTNDIKSRYNNVDIGGIVDLGFDVYLSDKLMLDFGIRLHAGLKDINDKDWRFNNQIVDYFASRNIYGGINLGLTYALKNWY